MKANGNGDIQSGLYSGDSDSLSELKRDLEDFIRSTVERSVAGMITSAERKLDETIEQTLQPILWELVEQRQKVTT